MRDEAPERACAEVRKLRHEVEALRETVRLQESFLAVIAHEIRNPLGPVLMSVDALLIEARHRTVDRDELVARLSSVQRYALRLRDDLDRLLDFSRVRNGRVDLHLQEVDLSEVVAETVRQMEPMLRASKSEARLSSVGGEQRGRWDAMRLKQIVWNLVSNATKYAPGAPIEISTGGDAHTATLTVTDHGSGILPADREAVFSKFERVHTRSHHTGFGIGLWLVRRIVDALGGTIEMRSTVNEGTTFTVSLPRQP